MRWSGFAEIFCPFGAAIGEQARLFGKTKAKGFSRMPIGLAK